MRKLVALMLFVSMPLAGVAQTLAPAQTDSIANSTLANPGNRPQLLEQILGKSQLLGATDPHSVPLWSTPDGRILAMVAAANDQPTYPVLPLAPQLGLPSSWHLVDVTNIVSGGVLLRLNDTTAAHIELSRSSLFSPTYILNPLCAGAVPGSASCATSVSAPRANSSSLNIGASILATDNLDLDFSYAASWLHRDVNSAPTARLTPAYESLSGFANPALPTLYLPGSEFADVQNSGINARGRLKFNDSQALDLGASLNRIQLSIPGSSTPLTSLNQAAVSFGVEYGSFTGTVTGRVLGSTEPYGATNPTGSRWTGLDVGISWRTPWRGMFSFGTQNLWSSGSAPNLNDPAANRELDANQARVPYVQYHQDL